VAIESVDSMPQWQAATEAFKAIPAVVESDITELSHSLRSNRRHGDVILKAVGSALEQFEAHKEQLTRCEALRDALPEAGQQACKADGDKVTEDKEEMVKAVRHVAEWFEEMKRGSQDFFGTLFWKTISEDSIHFLLLLACRLFPITVTVLLSSCVSHQWSAQMRPAWFHHDRELHGLECSTDAQHIRCTVHVDSGVGSM
jgi:hypothetical protein